MSGFWKFTNNYASKVSKILENEDILLEDLLDERETISELLASNSKLIEYLRRPEILKRLVEYIVDDDEYQRQALQLELEEKKEEVSEKLNGDTVEQINSPTAMIDDTTSNPDAVSAGIVDEEKKISKDSLYDFEDGDNDSKNISDDEDQNSESNHSSESESDSENSQYDDDDDDDNDVNEEETEIEKHNRRAQVAAEILSIDVWSITDAFMENTELLQTLWCTLDKPAPLPIFSATYFMKINEHLLDMKTDEMIQFIHQEPNLVERFMRHIETPPLMDFLLKVISTDKPDDSTGIIDVLKEQGLIPSLIEFLDNSVSSSIQSAAGDFLKAFITISANNAENTTIGPNELTRELVSEPMVRMLVDKMLQGGTGLSNGVGIVIEIIRKNNSDYDPVPVVYVTIESHPPTPRDPIYLGTLVKIFAEKMPEFTKLLEQKVDKLLETPFGKIEPLGFERFKICELVAELIHCSNMALLNDHKGEALVRERDEIRELLIEKHKEIMKRAEVDSNSSLDNLDIAKEIENMKLTKQQSNADAESAESEVEASQDDNEEALRANPVVGDKLKIALYDNKVIVTILDMFFKFPWNNFLHNVVFDIVQQILNATMEIGFNKFLAVDLFDRCNITAAIVGGHNRCIEYEETTGLRLGYMGHLSLIAEEVVKFISLDIHHTTEKAHIIDDAIKTEEWIDYVENTLAEIRNKYNAVLGSDGKEMNEHDMNLFQKVYGSGDFEDEEEEEDDDVILEINENKENGYLDSGHDGLDSSKYSSYMGEELTIEDRYGSSDEESEEDLINNDGQEWSEEAVDSDSRNKEDLEGIDDGIVDSQMGGNPYHEMSVGGLDDENITIDDDDYDDDVDEERFISNDNFEDYDDYEDPNDDGQSYKKMNHPLYQSDGSLRPISNKNFTH